MYNRAIYEKGSGDDEEDVGVERKKIKTPLFFQVKYQQIYKFMHLHLPTQPPTPFFSMLTYSRYDVKIRHSEPCRFVYHGGIEKKTKSFTARSEPFSSPPLFPPRGKTKIPSWNLFSYDHEPWTWKIYLRDGDGEGMGKGC